jgi:hypothetical protein
MTTLGSGIAWVAKFAVGLRVTGHRQDDGKIKGRVPRIAKPLTWLSILRGVGRGTVPPASERSALSSFFPALAIQDRPEGADEQ